MARKPSNRIIEIIQGLPPQDESGNCLISAAERDEVIRLCKVVDKRDQQLRKGKTLPAQSARKAAKKKARR